MFACVKRTSAGEIASVKLIIVCQTLVKTMLRVITATTTKILAVTATKLGQSIIVNASRSMKGLTVRR